MYLVPSNDNKRNPEVAEIQRMLNAIRSNFHHTWAYLSDDGIYGKQTASAVRQFQIYKGIIAQMTSDGPVLGDTTVRYIKEEYGRVPQLKPMSPYLSPYQTTKKKTPLEIAKEVTNSIIDCIQTFDDFLKREISYVNSLRASNPNALKQHFYSFATMLDPRMKKLKEHLVACNDETNVLDRAKHNRSAKSNRKNLVRELKKFDIVKKIERFLESKGFKGEIKVGGQNSKMTIKIKGGGILGIWSYKDLIIDLCKVTEWGKEEWYAELKKDFYDFLDGAIIGTVSTVIAEMVVGGVIALVGVTISAGWVVALIAIAALLISIVLSFLMEKADISFSQMAVEGYGEIISLVKF